jgi:hypothetical protein
MEWQAELVHAEPGRRVVRVSAREGERALGSALGEAEDAERAEDRALTRLRERVGDGLPRGGQRQRGVPQSVPSPVPAAATVASSIDTAPVPAAPVPAPPVPAVEPEVAARPGDGPAPEPGPEAAAIADAAPAASEPPMDPEDWSQELTQIDLQVQRLGWGRAQEGIYLQRAFGHPSRSRLTRWADLTAFLRALEALAPGADPATAAIPLQRRDLLQQCDTLLERLGWDTGTARRFLERHLALSSRQQLSDDQLLQFNMLLEEAWLEAGAPQPVCEPESGRTPAAASAPPSSPPFSSPPP